jgi:UDP-GlcNAc:undecaprenyl-phosphate GlcNAc-1-phosphate transferase
MDNPDGAIKRHKAPTPYLGGIAIFVGFLTSSAFVLPFESASLFLLIIALSLIVFLGFLDDILTLSPAQKFMGQTVVALCLLKAGFYLKIHAFYNPVFLGVSLLWFLVVMNAFNLVDVMDGLATTLALVSSFFFLLTALSNGSHEAVLLLGAFIGALAAFFRFNYPPAKIYMGDTGSLFLGTFLGVIPFLCSWGTHSLYGYCAPLFFLAIPLLEVAWLIAIRTYKGIPFYRGSADHYALILKREGLSVPVILLLSALAALIIGTAALVVTTRLGYSLFR